MYYTWVRSIAWFYIRTRRRTAANICTIIVEIDKRQSRKGVVNYVHNFQLLWLYPFLQRTILQKRRISRRAVTSKCIHLTDRITPRMGIVSFVFVFCVRSAFINEIDWPTTKQKIALASHYSANQSPTIVYSYNEENISDYIISYGIWKSIIFKSESY